MTTTVFVSGASGYIASQTVAELISRGYDVVGSVRSAAKGDPLVSYFGNKFKYEVVRTLEQEGAFNESLKRHPEVTYFLHTASPAVFVAEDNEKEILLPAINGTKFLLQSIKNYAPQIKGVVITSSMIAMVSPEDLDNPKFAGGESFWSDIAYEDGLKDSHAAYRVSKTFAEKAAWEFVEKEGPNFTLTTINPALVFGPQANDESAKGTLNVTAEIVSSIYKLNKDDKLPRIAGPFADVRDVAKAHVLAIEKEDAQGQRIIVCAQRFNAQSILNILRKNFPDLQDKLPVGNPADDDFSPYLPFNDIKSREILGLDYISLEQCVVDSINQIRRVN
ncbi:protein induced by osmotic stress [Scheffersomyces xylosifermentans]|uniref:protein induced by osmotic stress n=1 Tax=Scheffersomyces xylosifermentans TaxID=1304137 RepID=UPI00315DB987